jgi:Mrp family chromosome partitioning ATPase
VLIDSPPIASLTDTVVLASLADMVAFVVKHNENDRDLIRRCLKQLRAVHANVIGAVLNDVDFDRSANKGYYYAGYGYTTGDEKGSRKSSRKGGDRKIAL